MSTRAKDTQQKTSQTREVSSGHDSNDQSDTDQLENIIPARASNSNREYDGGSLLGEIESAQRKRREGDDLTSRRVQKRPRNNNNANGSGSRFIVPSNEATGSTSSDDEEIGNDRFEVLTTLVGLDGDQKDVAHKLALSIRNSAERDFAILSLFVASSVSQNVPSSSSGPWTPSKSVKDFIKSACRIYISDPSIVAYGSPASDNVMAYITARRNKVGPWPGRFNLDSTDYTSRRHIRELVDKELIELRSQFKKELCRGMPKSGAFFSTPTESPSSRGDVLPPIEKVAENIDKIGQRRSNFELERVDVGRANREHEESLVERCALLRSLVAVCVSGRKGHFWKWVDEVLAKLNQDSPNNHKEIREEVLNFDRNLYPKDPPKRFEEDGRSILPKLLNNIATTNE